MLLGLPVTPVEEHEMSVFENRVPKKIFVPTKEGMEKMQALIRIVRSFRNLVFSTNTFTVSNQGESYGWNM
jgi:hypothetical protein